MKAVVDRIVQYPNRYKLTNAETGEVLGTFDFEEVTGTVQQVGTEIDKELFDSIADDLAARVKLSGGELAGTIVTFSDISDTAANVASGDTSATLWGKVKNWFSRLKALAFKNKVATGDFEAGAIKNDDVAADAAIAQSKVSGLMTDYVASISVNGRTVTYKNKNGVNIGSITTQDTTYGLASQSNNGLMSSTDKTKLDGIDEELNNKANISGSYPNLTVGNADKLGDKAASEYALMTIKTATEWETDNTILAAGAFGYDSTNKVTKIGDGITAWNALPAFSTTRLTFATAEWGDISRIAANGDAQKYFNVGDEKTVELSTGEEVTLVILGFNHDDLADGSGKAGMTIGMKNLLADSYGMNANPTSVGGWDESAMRTSTMATLLSQLPSDLQGVIKQVNKKATAGGASTTITTSSDKLWLFSEVEIDGTTSSGYVDEGEQYEYWKTVKDGTVAADRIKYLSNGSGSKRAWWLRSPWLDPLIGSGHFRLIGILGGIGSDYADIAFGVSFGFCV